MADVMEFDEALTPDVLQDTVVSLYNELGIEKANVHLYQERLAELELALEDEGWRRIGMEGEMEFSPQGLRKIVSLSRIMFLKNPVIQRAVEVRSFYVWGQGVKIEADDERANDIIQKFLDDKLNRKVFTGHAARVKKDQKLQIDGNIFFVLFTNSIDGTVKIRTAPMEEITDIITNPQDREEVWFYLREWTEERTTRGGHKKQTPRKAYYPDVAYATATPQKRGRGARPTTIGDIDIQWDAPVYHVKVGHLDGMRFGVPETYAALDWARAYKNFLEDWASIVRAISRFAWKLTAKKNKLQVARERLNYKPNLAELAEEGSNGNEPPHAGSFFIRDPDTDLTPINKSGATTSAEDGKYLRLMVASAMHIPDTILSNDPQQGALATAKTLDRPTELTLTDRQALWSDIIKDICDHVLEANDIKDIDVKVTFPNIVERDTREWIGSIIDSWSANGKADAHVMPKDVFRRLLLTALGVDDIDEVMAAMEDIDTEDEENAATAQASLNLGGPEAEEDEEEVTEALKGFVTALTEAYKELTEAAA